MWLLESDDAFEGRKLWLRPGKTYLFGRTASEAGQLAISHNTISRKHLTITVEPLKEWDCRQLTKTSRVTIEDLRTKIGTTVNGQKIKGEKYVIEGREAELTLGKCPSKFSLSWFPVGFSFSFSSKELRTQPFESLRERFEPLDVKLLDTYDATWTTHVVTKKRNTAKGLQALIHGKYIVTETFLDGLSRVTERPDDDGTPSLLEQDFEGHWPKEMDHLPPKGGEPVEHPDKIYSPDKGRKNVFEGYTFVFYDQTQYANLLAPITSGGGKGLMTSLAGSTLTVNAFVQWVKNVAGEKGLGSFEDGSEGKGVVVVRYLPAKGDLIDWYKDFITQVSLKLDHRPIEQSEFLEAVLIKDASILRRPLEVESSANTQEPRDLQSNQEVTAPSNDTNTNEDQGVSQDVQHESTGPSRRGKARQVVKKRFAGFDDGDDVDMNAVPQAPVPAVHEHVEDESGLFVSQAPSEADAPQDSRESRRLQRKRAAGQDDDLMEGMATAAERYKRQRIEQGEDVSGPAQEMVEPAAAPVPKKKAKKELDVLAVTAQNREAEEARARQEREDLAYVPDDIDLSEIRRLNIVEEMPVRSSNVPRTREQDIAEGRWNPKWNGVKNFKKFKPRGEALGRQPARVIVQLTEVKAKEFGVGDDYWLEETDSQKRKNQASVSQPSQDQPPEPSPRRGRAAQVIVEDSGSDLEDVDEVVENVNKGRTRQATQTRNTRATQASKQTTRGKRAADESAKSQPVTKRQRGNPSTRQKVPDSDASEDEFKFSFGKRK